MLYNKLLLLSGTPASGKDTVTTSLSALDERFVHFRKHKGGAGGRADDTYIHVSIEEFDSIARNDGFLQHHGRYGRGYGVSHAELLRLWEQGLIPVVHAGRYENLVALRTAPATVISVLLLTPQSVTRQRLGGRHPGNMVEAETRMAAYFEERAEIANLIATGEPLDFDLILDSSLQSATETAKLILALAQHCWG